MTNEQITNLLRLEYTYNQRIAIMERNKAALGRDWTTAQQLELERDQRSLRLVQAERRQRETAPDERAREITSDDARFLVLEDDVAQLRERIDTAILLLEKQSVRMTHALDNFAGQLLTLETWREADDISRRRGQWSLRAILLLLTCSIVWLATR